jgi:pimeloyl-ACP methyl ester carboxylesterase
MSPAFPVDLPPVLIRGGPGPIDEPPELATLTIADWAATVLAGANAAGWDRFVLVGHSLGGATIAEVARVVPDRVAHLVFVSAVVPEEGGTVLEMLPPEIFERAANGLTDDVVRDMFCTDMDDEQSRFVLANVGTEVIGTMTETITRKGTSSDLPITFVRLARDNALPLAIQDACIGLDTGHDVMISHPIELAAVLDAIADGSG